jgi:hypothetical protein
VALAKWTEANVPTTKEGNNSTLHVHDLPLPQRGVLMKTLKTISVCAMGLESLKRSSWVLAVSPVWSWGLQWLGWSRHLTTA